MTKQGAPVDKAAQSVDWLTVVSLSMLAYLLGTALHEHAGHALACLAVHGQIIELNAFYVNCGYQGVSELGVRLVALAGPVMSIVCGVVGFVLLDRVATTSATTYFLWLFSTIGFLTGTGYMLFSGVLGIGDFGTSSEGVIYQLQPEWLWRIALVVVGLGSYLLVIRVMVGKLDTFIGGEGQERVKRAQRLSLTSYLSGVIASVLIGFLNPLGIYIVLISAAAASAGGTSGLVWGMQTLNRKKQTGMPPFTISRDWRFIVVGIAFTLGYAAVFGPSLRFGP